jgi:excisionase family DNA binding protein
LNVFKTCTDIKKGGRREMGWLMPEQEKKGLGGRWMTVEEVAREKGVHVNSVYKALETGKIRGDQVGSSERKNKRYLIDRNSLDGWVIVKHKPKGYRH